MIRSDNANMQEDKTESTLLTNISQGDTKAFEYLFLLYFPKLKQFLSGFLDTEAEAEDLAQDVFVRFWQNRQSVTKVENLNAYLYRMAKNALYTYLDRSFFPDSISEASVNHIRSTDEVEELIFANEQEELIRIAIEKMPHQRKTIFRLSREQGFSNDEIAIQLNISKRTVETHISAALADIRKVISVLLLFF